MKKPEFLNFPPKAPWIGGDLQTVRNNIMRRRDSLSAWPAQTRYVDTADGTGDQMAVTFNRQPVNRQSVQGAPGPESEPGPEQSKRRPLVCLIHGLSGSENSFAVTLAAAYFLRKGFDTCRINLRGAEPYRHLATKPYHAGKSEDLKPVLAHLAKTRDLFLIGHSMGGNLLIKAMAEFGGAYNIIGAASLSAPVHMSDTQRKFSRPRNKIYQYYILKGMKQSWLGFRGVSDELKNRIKAVKTVYQFDDELLAPSIGLTGAEQYYEQNSAIAFFDEVKTKMLICAAADDPWIPVEPYTNYDWSRNTNLVPALTKTGGHCGFHQAGHRSTWFDRACYTLIKTLTA